MDLSGSAEGVSRVKLARKLEPRRIQAAVLTISQLIAHDALSALINLTNSALATVRIAKIDGFVAGLVRMIIVGPGSRCS